jgi:8-oxo-dGTP diphosphatase
MEIPKVGIGVLIIRDEKVLLSKRINSAGEGTWCLPGGRLEFNETFEGCGKREVKEETGLDVDSLEVISLSNDIMYGDHWITIGIKPSIVNGEPTIKEPQKFIEMGWFDFDSLPEPLFLASKKIIDNYLAKRFYDNK